MAGNDRIPLALHKAIEYELIRKVEILLPVTRNVNQPDENGDTAFILACQKKDEVIRLLLDDDRVDVNAVGKKGYTALHYLSLNGKLWAVQIILNRDNVDVNAKTDTKDTPLMLAARKGHVDVIRFLAKKGALSDHRNDEGCSALFYAYNNRHYESAKVLIELNHPVCFSISFGKSGGMCDLWDQNATLKSEQWNIMDMIQELLENGADVRVASDYAGKQDNVTLQLYEAIEYESIHKVEMLLPKIENVNQPDENGDTAFILACQKKDEIIRLLLDDDRVDVNAVGNNGYTPLHYLSLNGKLWAVQIILNRDNADVNAKTDTKDTPLMLAAKKGHVDVIRFLAKKGALINHGNSKGCSALIYSCNNGHYESAKALIELGAQVNMHNSWKQTALMKASQWGFRNVCLLLLDKGARIDLECNYGQTALIYACYRGQLEVAELFLEKGANVNHAFYNPARKISVTPLIEACYCNSPELVSLLLEHGAYFNHPPRVNIALSYCQEKGYDECAALLLKAGAKPN